jgi:hypothetical protein
MFMAIAQGFVMKKLIFVLFFIFVASTHAATVEEIHVESYQGMKLATYRGVCQSTDQPDFVVQLEQDRYRYHGPAGYGITRTVKNAVQAACAEQQVVGLNI